MVNVEKHIAYWVAGAKEEWDTVELLIKNRKVRQGLFFTHLALEKALKAHVTRFTKDIPPRSHDLVGLAGRSGLEITESQGDLLKIVNDFNVVGRYPDIPEKVPSVDDARQYVQESQEMLEWLLSQL